MKIFLNCTTTTEPDLSGLHFYVDPENCLFDEDLYCEHNNINVSDIDPDTLKTVRDAANDLGPGVWLLVEHTTED